MTIKLMASGLYNVVGHNNNQLFSSLKQAMSFTRYMGFEPVLEFTWSDSHGM